MAVLITRGHRLSGVGEIMEDKQKGNIVMGICTIMCLLSVMACISSVNDVKESNWAVIKAVGEIKDNPRCGPFVLTVEEKQ